MDSTHIERPSAVGGSSLLGLLAAGAALLGGLTFLGGKDKEGATPKSSRARQGSVRAGVRTSLPLLLRPDRRGVITQWWTF